MSACNTKNSSMRGIDETLIFVSTVFGSRPCRCFFMHCMGMAWFKVFSSSLAMVFIWQSQKTKFI